MSASPSHAGGTLLLNYRLTVRFSDCDPLGHVNNAVYSTYIEQARIVLWRKQLGFELRKAEERFHLLAGLVVAVDAIDRVIEIIRSIRPECPVGRA